jgi:hypothetical protein
VRWNRLLGKPHGDIEVLVLHHIVKKLIEMPYERKVVALARAGW